jgi:hypothetical protein
MLASINCFWKWLVVQVSEKALSGAKAPFFFLRFYGMAEAMPLTKLGDPEMWWGFGHPANPCPSSARTLGTQLVQTPICHGFVTNYPCERMRTAGRDI